MKAIAAEDIKVGDVLYLQLEVSTGNIMVRKASAAETDEEIFIHVNPKPTVPK